MPDKPANLKLTIPATALVSILASLGGVVGWQKVHPPEPLAVKDCPEFVALQRDFANLVGQAAVEERRRAADEQNREAVVHLMNSGVQQVQNSQAATAEHIRLMEMQMAEMRVDIRELLRRP